MATIEQFEAVTEAWERLSHACDDAACCPTLKVEVVILFREMADNFKNILECIEPNYYKASGENMELLVLDLDSLTEKIKQVIKFSDSK